MSVYKRRSGRYQVLLDLEPSATGARRRKSIGTHRTRKEAEAAERKALSDRDDGYDLSRHDATLADVTERFLRDHSAVNLTVNAHHHYEQVWRLYVAPHLSMRKLSKLRVADITELYAKLAHLQSRRGGALSDRSRYHVHRFLYRVFSWAEQQELIERNVMRRVEAPSPNESPARSLTPDEAARILVTTEGSRWHPFFVLALATGARKGELAALQWMNVDLDRARITVRASLSTDHRGGSFIKATKTEKMRVVPLPSSAVGVLRDLCDRQSLEKDVAAAAYRDQGFVFADAAGNAPCLDTPAKVFVAAARKLGIQGVTLHSCRHTVATWALAAGRDVKGVAALLGHSASSTTLDRYGHVVTGAQERVVATVNMMLENAQARLTAGEEAA